MSRRRARPFMLLALGALIGSVAVVTAWMVDSRAHRGSVLPNVRIANESARGMDTEELTALVARLAETFATATVEVGTPGGSFRATIPELGAKVDEQETVAAVLAAGRRGTPPRRVWTWARSFMSPVKVPVAIDVDRRALERIVAERDPARTPPVEPTITVREGHIEGVPGKPGRGIDPARLAAALGRVSVTEGTLKLSMQVTSVPPRFSKEEADRLAGEAERLAAGGLQVTVGGESATVPTPTLQSWLRAVPGEEALALGLRSDADVLDNLAELVPEAGVEAVDAGFTVSGGRVSITPSRTGTACCAPEARDVITSALTDPAKRAAALELPLKTVMPRRDEEAAAKLGVVEQIGTFTTSHAAGEPRVRNIQRMADTVRGAVFEPGETFSINGTVGRRTREQGYVEAPIISGDYKFEADVGGGVSQFATTMFNAAFFGGLDITEYAMHGLYISRYPYGREATLSFPSPDLKVRNSTPYGVLVWTSYTDTSITVSFYSTKHATGEQTNQTRVEGRAKPPSGSPPDTPAPGPCITVTTERTRTFVDGRTATDRFTGLYAPAEGWSCA